MYYTCVTILFVYCSNASVHYKEPETIDSRIQKQRNAALIGGGQARIDAQHAKVHLFCRSPIPPLHIHTPSLFTFFIYFFLKKLNYTR